MSLTPGLNRQLTADKIWASTVSCVRQARLQRTGILQKFLPDSPELAVEVISPTDNLNEVDFKVRDYFNG